jgi:hypothetical protein
MARIYGKVENIEDISRINCIIRDEMLKVESEAELSELKKRSDYLCTLTYSPFWQKKFENEIDKLREVAIEENRITVKTANIIAKYKGFDKEYSPWKKEIDIEHQLKQIPQTVIDELTKSIFTLKLSLDILEDLREEFCDIRKAMVLCEDVECLNKLKKAVDILSVLPYLESFKEHFDEGILAAIDKLIVEEKERSIKLANIIAEVKGFNIYYQSVNVNDFEFRNNEELNEYIQKLFEEEEKSENYIPTEAKYEKGAKVWWLVYYLPRRKRDYAKRIYLPERIRNVKIIGPDYFVNRFGNKIWGIKIEYENEVRETDIIIRGKKIHLPTRWIKREKIVPVPEDAQNIRITEEKPESAMDIA